jgi:quercetin dioxygenase-like cupin family protein
METSAHQQHVRFGKALGTKLLLASEQTGGAFGVVEHDLPAGQLGSPVHTHAHEDEYSYVVSGTLTAQIGDEVVTAGPSELVVKPRGIPHAFWNAGDETLRFVEVISPGGFENYFFELAAPFNAHDEAAMGEIVGRYELDLRMETIGELLARNGLQPPF